MKWILAVLTVTVGTAISWNSANVYAATIICGGNTGLCTGTDGSDVMLGDNQQNFVCGRGGNDNIDLRDGGDKGIGGQGNDIINGGYGDDLIVGDGSPDCRGSPGADRLLGGPGDDLLFHASIVSGNPDTASDGQRDYIDCGPGTDSATINTSIDGDTAINCEKVTSG